MRASVNGGALKRQQRRVAIRRPMKAIAAPEKGGPRSIATFAQYKSNSLTPRGKIAASSISGRPEAGRRCLARSGRDRPQRHPARLQDPRFRQIPLSRAEEIVRGAQAPEGGRDQGDQAQARHRRARLRGEDALGAPLLRRGRQGQGDVALPRPRNGASGDRLRLLQQVRTEMAPMAKVESEPSWKAGR